MAGKAEYVIQESGCGLFHVLLLFCANILLKIPTAYTMMFMSYGNYNPGWRCMDNMNFTKPDNASKSTVDNETSGYTAGSCDLFESCRHVEFDPETSTIVSEWHLLCDRGWIPSFIISIQMAGLLVGCFLSGQIGDTFGRKKSLYGALAVNGVLSFISSFVTQWQVFGLMRFLCGVMLGFLLTLYFILPSEFLNNTWRGRVAPIPSWHIGGIVFALVAMACKDWRLMHIIVGVLSLVCCIPAVWIPESLRWLEVNNKTKEFNRVVKKISRLNKNSIALKNYNETDSAIESSPKVKKYTIVDIFRKGYRAISVVLCVLWVSCSVIYYAISFGVKAMYGDFYINMIIIYAIDIPFSIFPILTPNLIGRKKSSIVFLAMSASCLIGAAALELWAPDGVKRVGTLCLALLGKTAIGAGWYTITTYTIELYPTTVRGIGLGYVNLMSRLGGIVAPFLIPNNPDTAYFSYLPMGVLGLICCGLILILPETKGRTLKETFEGN